MNDTCSDEEIDDILYMDDDVTYEYEEVVVMNNMQTLDENVSEWSDDYIVDDDLMQWDNEEVAVTNFISSSH